MLAFSAPCKWSAHDPPELSTLPPNVRFCFRPSANSIQWHCNVSVVLNEFSIVTSESQEASDVLTVFRLRPIHYHTSLMFLGVDVVLINAKAAKINFLTSPGAFCLFGLETMLCQ